MQCVHHRLELADLAARAAGPDGGRIAAVRREEADRVVAPVVRQPPLKEERLGHVLVHREQFDGGDAQVKQVRDRGFVAQAGVGPAEQRRNVRMAHGEALDVDLVQDRVRVAVPGAFVILPAEIRVHDQAPGHVRRGVQAARFARVGDVLAEHLRPERDRSADRLRVGVEQQLGRVAPQAPGRVPRPADAVPVGLPRADSRHERMPDIGVVIPQRDLGFRACLIEQAQGDAGGDAGGDREVRARHAQALAGRGAKRERLAGERDGGAGIRGGAGGRDSPGRRRGLATGHCWAFLLGRAGRLRGPGPRRAGAGSGRRSGRSSRSGGRRRSRRRCRRGSTR